jgi:hypothetical protein
VTLSGIEGEYNSNKIVFGPWVMRRLFKNWQNHWGFWLRQRFRWRRGGYVELPPVCLPEEQTPLKRRLDKVLQENLAGYGNFKHYQTQIPWQRFIENVVVLAQLEALAKTTWGTIRPDNFADKPQAPRHRWLDVGAKNMSYAPALDAIARRWLGPEYQLRGVELDGYQIYTDGYSRADYAEAFIAPYPQMQYHVADVMTIVEPFDHMTWLLPFVFEDPCLQWSLPRRYFCPEKMLAHVIGLLGPGGALWVVNQGQLEGEEQRRLFDLVRTQASVPDWTYQAVGLLPDPVGFFTHPRYGWVVTKQPERLSNSSQT